ncbi:MAG: DUF4142 domain-containing protein [Bdellovibrionales bacterium]
MQNKTTISSVTSLPLIIAAMVLALLAVIFMSPPAQAETMKKVSGFAETASLGNRFEIESGNLMLKQSSNDQVLKIAETMVRDHTASESKLRTALGATATDADILPTSLDAAHNKLMDKLRTTSMTHTDRVYLDIQAQAHRDSIRAFEEYVMKGDNPELRQYAQDSLPTKRAHLEMIVTAQNNLGPQPN